MYYICLDIGGTSVKTAITDKNGNIYTNKAEMLRRLYVACSRTRHKLYICYG